MLNQIVSTCILITAKDNCEMRNIFQLGSAQLYYSCKLTESHSVYCFNSIMQHTFIYCINEQLKNFLVAYGKLYEMHLDSQGQLFKSIVAYE